MIQTNPVIGKSCLVFLIQHHAETVTYANFHLSEAIFEPAGLTLSASGRLSGTATSAGTFTFTVAVTDSLGEIASQTYSLSVVAAGTMTRSGVLAQVAAGGGWRTEISVRATPSQPLHTRAYSGDLAPASRIG